MCCPAGFLLDPTAFCSPSGQIYRFKHLPFGIKVAQDVFQEKMDIVLADCDGILNIANDIIVYGKDLNEYNTNIHNMMQTTDQYGIVFNAEKCIIKEVKFFGMIYSSDGVKPDLKK